jgi:hypothetical protein
MPPRTGARWRLSTLVGLLVASAAGAAWGQGAGPFDAFTVVPCRVLDTRFATPQNPVNNGQTKAVAVAGNLATFQQGGASNCGIPDAARGVFVNVVAIAPTSGGHLTVFPYHPTPQVPLASTINFGVGQTIANGVLIPICDPGSTACHFDLLVNAVMVGSATHSVHILMDVTGYLLPTP